MKLELKIGKPVEVKVSPTNVYELVATGMSGDADHYEHSSHFGDLDSIMPYVQLLHILDKMDWNSKCDYRNVDALFKITAGELGLDVAKTADWFYGMVGKDITCEGQRAMLDGIKMFWYDANGQKFAVEIKEAHEN